MSDVKWFIRFILIVLAILVVIGCIPIPQGPYDGGVARTYNALLYKIVVWDGGHTVWIDKDGNSLGGIPEGTIGFYFFPANFKNLSELEQIEFARQQKAAK